MIALSNKPNKKRFMIKGNKTPGSDVIYLLSFVIVSVQIYFLLFVCTVVYLANVVFLLLPACGRYFLLLRDSRNHLQNRAQGRFVKCLGLSKSPTFSGCLSNGYYEHWPSQVWPSTSDLPGRQSRTRSLFSRAPSVSPPSECLAGSRQALLTQPLHCSHRSPGGC